MGENKIKIEVEKVDQHGWGYYENLPEGYRIATLNDFHVNGKRKIGMKYLIKRSYSDNHYEIHRVVDELKAEVIKVFIEESMVYVEG